MDGPGNTGNRQARSFHSGTVQGDSCMESIGNAAISGQTDNGIKDIPQKERKHEDKKVCRRDYGNDFRQPQ